MPDADELARQLDSSLAALNIPVAKANEIRAGPVDKQWKLIVSARHVLSVSAACCLCE